MRRVECPREPDVLDALASRRWPARCDAELREHVGGCAICADAVTVASAFLAAEATDTAIPEPPPASLVWWRAQIRAREEAARAAARPLRAVQSVALVCGAVVLVLVFGGLGPHIWSSVTDVLARGTAVLPDVTARGVSEAALAALASRGVQLAVAAWLVLGPLAVYLAFARD